MYLNTRGFNLSGRIANKIGFFQVLLITKSADLNFFSQMCWLFAQFLVEDISKIYKILGIDYFDGRGYITFNTAKYIDIQFGYDYSKKIIQRSVKKKSFGSIFCQNCLKILMTDPYYVNC